MALESELSYVIYILTGLIVSYLVNPMTFARNRYKLQMIGAFILLVILGTARDVSVGKDTFSYVEILKGIAETSGKIGEMKYFDQEPGFSVFIYCCSLLSSDYIVLFFFISLIESGVLLYFFRTFLERRLRYWFFLSPFVLLYIYSFSAMRFGLAVSFCMLSFCALKKCSYVKAILFTIVGMLFHTTVAINLLFIASYMLLKCDIKPINNNRKLCFILIFLFVILSYVVGSFFIVDIVGRRFIGYLEQDVSFWGQLPLLIMLIVSIAMYYRRRDRNDITFSVEIWGIVYTLLMLPAVGMLNISRILLIYLPLRLVAYAHTWEGKDFILKIPSYRTGIIFSLVVIYVFFRLIRDNSGIIPYVLNYAL